MVEFQPLGISAQRKTNEIVSCNKRDNLCYAVNKVDLCPIFVHTTISRQQSGRSMIMWVKTGSPSQEGNSVSMPKLISFSIIGMNESSFGESLVRMTRGLKWLPRRMSMPVYLPKKSYRRTLVCISYWGPSQIHSQWQKRASSNLYKGLNGM